MQDSLDYASKFLQIWRTLIHPQCHWPTTHIPFYADFACKWEYALQLICIRIIGISGVLTALKRIFKSELLSAWKVAWSFDRGGEEREKGKWTPASTLLDEVLLTFPREKEILLTGVGWRDKSSLSQPPWYLLSSLQALHATVADAIN